MKIQAIFGAIILMSGISCAMINATTDENLSLSIEHRVKNLEDKLIAFEEGVAASSNPTKVDVDPSSIASGKKLFIQNCRNCHGSSGRGDGPFARTLPSIQNLTDPDMWNKTNQEIFDAITNGKSSMPGYGGSLSKEERWNLVNFVRTLAPKPVEKTQ